MTHPDTSPAQEVRELMGWVLIAVIRLVAICVMAFFSVLLWTVYQGVM